MFVKSFLQFKQKNIDFIFELVNTRQYSDDTLILENKEQSLSILNKKGVPEDNEDYLILKNDTTKLFKNLNYLGLMTKFRFEQDVSLQELRDLLVWLKQSGNKLPNNALTYKHYEDIKDDIILTDNKQRVKMIFNKLPSQQKKLANGSELFFEKALEIHKLGIINEFGRKISAQKTEEDLINYMDDFISKNSESITFDKIINKLKTLNTRIKIEDIDKGLIMAEILDYPASKAIGSSDWCIVSAESYWNSYTSGARKQFFMWDFSENRTSASFLIGFTTNDIGQITDIHDKYDASLSGNVPIKIKDALRNINISIDPFEYKMEIIQRARNSEDSQFIKHDDDNNIIIIKVGKNDFSYYKSNSWGYYNPFPYGTDMLRNNTPYDFYMIFNFKYALNDERFSHGIETSDDGDYKIIEIRNNDNKRGKIEIVNGKDPIIFDNNAPTSVAFILDLYNTGYIRFKDVSDYYKVEKEVYLNKIEPYVKGSAEISSSYRKSKSVYINTSTDEGSTGNYWLFKIENDELSHFSTTIMKNWNPSGYNIDIQRFNLYVLIKLDAEFRDGNFIRFIKLEENEATIKFNNKSESKIKYTLKGSIEDRSLPTDIEELINDGYMKPKSLISYNREIERSLHKILDSSDSDYESDSDLDLFGKALLEFLLMAGNIDEDDYEDVEYIDIDNDPNVHRKLLIPSGDHYNMYLFQVFDMNMVIGGYSKEEWAIGTDEEADIAALECVKQYVEEYGVNAVNSYTLNSYIDAEAFANYYADDEYYFEDLIRDDYAGYDIERVMKSGAEDELNEARKDVSKLEIQKIHFEELYDKADSRKDDYEDFVDEKLEKIDELISDYETNVGRIKRLRIMKKKLRLRLKTNMKRYENLLENIQDKISEIEIEISELNDLIWNIENEDDDDYWEFDEDAISEKVSDMVDNNRQEIEDNPIQWLEDMGYDDDQKKDAIESFVDFDGIAQYIIDSDGRGNSLSGYDGDEQEHTYSGNNETYYLYLQNKN